MNLLVAGCHFGLVDVIEFERLSKGEDVLLSAHCLHGRMASSLTMRRQNLWVALARHYRPDDGHAGNSGDVGHDVMKLQVHLRQGLLQVPRCLGWVETSSLGQSQIELSGQQVDDGL